MAGLYFSTFWLIIFTGAIRKWMFPSVTVLYLLQDVPLVLAYLYAMYTGLFTRGFVALGVTLLSTLLVLQGLIQVIFGGLGLFILFVGYHNYLFYLPMLFIFPVCLLEQFRKNFVWWNLMLSIPMSLLAYAQDKAPRAAWINKTTEGEAFGLPGSDVARVSGTFNFVSFYAIWAGLVAALCVGEWLLPRHRRSVKRTWLLVVCTACVMLCFLLSGSRAAIALAAVGVMGGVLASIVLGSTRAILSVLGIVFMLPIAGAAIYVISPEEFNIMVYRFTGEGSVEDNSNRLEDGTVGFLTKPKFSLIGQGIGIGTDAAHVGSVGGYDFTYTLSEYDLIRNVIELGTLVGVTYVMTRILFFIALIFLAIRLVRDGSSPHVLPVSFFLMAQTTQGDMTRNAAISGSMTVVSAAFILSAYYNPDNLSEPELEPDELTTRSA
jgi:hypothetical protein